MPLFPQTTGSVPNFTRNNASAVNTYPGMSINIPTMLQQSQITSTPKPVLVGVHGFDSVKKFPTEPNQTLSFHDMDADFEYIVDTDVNNQPSYKIIEYNVISEEEYLEKYKKAVNKDIGLPTAEEWKRMVERLEKLEKELSENNAKQSVRFQKSSDEYSGSAYSAKPTAIRSEDFSDVSGYEE